MKFFDLGARHGEAYEQLRRDNYLVDTDWMVGIEGNPEISTVPEHYDEWIRAAAWVKEGWADYCAGAAWSVSSGLAGHNCLESDDKQTMHRVWTIDFPALIAREEIQPPALFIVGEVVKLREKLAWFEGMNAAQ